MGNFFQEYLNGERVYTCTTCHAHLAVYEDVISKGFQGRHGPAYLFNAVSNVIVGVPEERDLLTGKHTVADIKCLVCQTTLGWKYIKAFTENQKYKEDKYIMEKAKICKETMLNDEDFIT